MRSAALTGVAAAAALLAGAEARVFTGTVSGQTWPFLARFAFGSDGGSASIEYSYASSATSPANLLAYSESKWNGDAGCAALEGSPSFAAVPLPLAANTAVTASYAGVGKSYYYWALGDSTSPCQNAVGPITYTLTVTQADGNQLGYDEMGIPAIYGVFWSFLLVTLAVHVWASYFRKPVLAPALIRVFTIGLSLHMLSNFFHMINWSVIASKGTANVGLEVCGALLRLAANIAVWVLAAVAAIGYGVSTYSFGDWREKSNLRGLIALGALVITYTVVALVYAAKRSNPSDASPDKGAAVAAIFILVETIVYIIWFFRRIRATIAAEVSVPKKAFLKQLMVAMACLFVVLPFAEMLLVVVPDYEALRVTIGVDQFFTWAVYAALAFYVLWPARAADCFRVFDGTVAASMLGGGDFTETGGVSLDEAYSYAAVADAPSGPVKAMEPTL